MTLKTLKAAAAAVNVTTTAQLKTYTDPTGFFTLQYPTDWTAQYEQPATKFDKPSTIFRTNESVVAITVEPSKDNSPEEFRYSASFMGSYLKNNNPGMYVFGEGFGSYSIGGYDTYAVEYRDAENPANPIRGMMLVSRIGYQEMIIVVKSVQDSFDQQIPAVQKMIESIKITGIR